MFKKKIRPIPYEVRFCMRYWKREEGLDFEIPYTYKRGVLNIITTKPGIIIGYKGKTINNLKEKLSNVKGFRKIKISHVRDYE